MKSELLNKKEFRKAILDANEKIFLSRKNHAKWYCTHPDGQTYEVCVENCMVCIIPCPIGKLTWVTKR